MKTFIALIALAFLFICVVEATEDDAACKDVLHSGFCLSKKKQHQCRYNNKITTQYCRKTCHRCDVPLKCEGQSKPLGIQSKAIRNCQIDASSYYDDRYVPWQARLNTDSYGWTPKTQQQGISMWLEVDMLTVHYVDAIATQGSKHNSEWMKSYNLEYSIDGKDFKNYESGKVFNGNTDRNTVVKHDIDPPVRARFIRVIPKTWYSWPSMRMELYGCKSPINNLSTAFVPRL